MKRRSQWWVCLSATAAFAACSTGTEPHVKPCTDATSVPIGNLSLGAYSSTTPSADGCVQFPAGTGPDTIEYLVVAQSATTTPNRRADFRLSGDAVAGGAAVISSLQNAVAEPSPAEGFHTWLRETERRRVYDAGPSSDVPMLHSRERQPPTVGDQRTFSVCANLVCTVHDQVRATAKAVGTHVAIYVDTLAANSLDPTVFDTLQAAFDNRIYPLDTLAFGAESDIDANGLVIVLMTPTVNRLVTATQCATSGYVSGYFFGADLDPLNVGNSNFNQAELFYTLVPDPTGLYSCSHDATQVRRVLPITFVHEFQHMISFNQHVLLRGGETEVLWLNEAMSHYAEELGGRSYLPGDTATFSDYLKGDAYNGYQYLDNTGANFLLATAGSGTLAERGAGWLFVRYLIDQLASDTTMAAWSVVSRQLVRTTVTGAANVVARTGKPFDQTLAQWALALWVSDLPGFTPLPELRYRSWAFRTTYASLHAQQPNTFAKLFPLAPSVTLGPEVELQGTLRSGSGVYQRVRQPPGRPTFTLQLAGPSGAALPASLAPRLTVIRVR